MTPAAQATARSGSLGALPVAAREDGNKWRSFDPSTKATYLTGLLQGMALGKTFIFYPMAQRGEDDCLNNVEASFNDSLRKYLTNVTVGQLSDGLDVFYEDYRNRSIAINNGVWVVLQEISGATDERIDAMTQLLRKWALEE